MEINDIKDNSISSSISSNYCHICCNENENNIKLNCDHSMCKLCFNKHFISTHANFLCPFCRLNISKSFTLDNLNTETMITYNNIVAEREEQADNDLIFLDSEMYGDSERICFTQCMFALLSCIPICIFGCTV